MKEKLKNFINKIKSIRVEGDTVTIIVGMLLLLNLACIAFLCGNKSKDNREETPVIIYVDNVDTIPDFMFKSPEEGLRDALEYYHVKHADIVYAQAKLETANFTSYQCVHNNNLFGLYNGNSKNYFRFLHWSQSIKGYVKYIQYKYKSGDYYQFLANLGYAGDKDYIKKLKEIVKENNK